MNSDDFGRLAASFPNPETAPADGPLAYGGNLEPPTLLAAYSRGIFPWYEEGLPILWHSPDPRAILPLDSFRLPPRSARKIAHTPFKITLDKDFAAVMAACGNLRESTWITHDMLRSYVRLHDLGYAHSIETWLDGKLVGGLYGVSLGRVFCGESMFHLQSEASRAALAALAALLRQKNFLLLDIQQETPHMLKMGAIGIPRSAYLRLLARALAASPQSGGVLCPWPGWRENLAFKKDEGIWIPGQQPEIF